MNQRKRHFYGFLFFLLFALYWCGITCFTHSHVENGVVIVHSHPYEDAHHTHSDVQFETIFNLTHFFSLECSDFHFEGLIQYEFLLIPAFVWIIHGVTRIRRCRHFLRAPPAVVV